jgi:hypothetical protein
MISFIRMMTNGGTEILQISPGATPFAAFLGVGIENSRSATEVPMEATLE